MKKIFYFVSAAFILLFTSANFIYYALAAGPAITNISAAPNPFNPADGPCRFSYTTSDPDSKELFILLQIYNGDYDGSSTGAPYKTLRHISQKFQPAGANYLLWDGKDDNGNLLNDGTYKYYFYVDDHPDGIGPGNYVFSDINYKINISVTTTEDKSIRKGWPKVFPDASNAIPVLYDLDNDNKKEIIFCGNGPANGIGINTENKIYILREDGSTYTGWPVTLVNEGEMYSAVSIGDISGDSRPEIVLVTTWGSLFVFSENGVSLPGFSPLKLPGGLSNWIQESPILFDVDGDGKKEIIVRCFDPAARKDKIYVLSGSAELLYTLEGMPNDQFKQITIGFIEKKAHIFSVSANGYLYIWSIAGKLLEGYPKYINALLQDISSINISMEKPYLFASERSGNRFLGLNHSGEEFGDWAYPAGFLKERTAAKFWITSFIKGNGKIYVFTEFLDFVTNNLSDPDRKNLNAKLYLFDLSGRLVKGWPKIFTNTIGEKDVLLGAQRGAISADVDGDGNEEIIIGNRSFNELHAFKINGEEVSGWPKKFNNAAGVQPAAVDDIDGDGKLELVGFAHETHENVRMNVVGQLILPWSWLQVIVWDLDTPGDNKALTWPQYRHDAAHTGLYAPSYKEKREAPPIPGTPEFGDLSRDSRLFGKYSLSWREAADDHETGFRDYWNYLLSLSEEEQYGGYQYSDSEEEEGLDLLKGYWDSYLERIGDLLADLKEYEVYRNGEYVASVIRPGYAEPGLPEGQYNYYIKAIDRYGNASEPSGLSSSIVVDRTPPVITDISAPRQFDLQRQVCKIAYTISDNLAKELFVLLEVSQKPKKEEPPLVVRRIIQNFQPAGANYLFWDGCDDSGNLLDRGEYLFRFYVSDETGIDLDNIDRRTTAVSEEQAIRLHKDERKKKETPQVKAPEIVILSPENNSLTNASSMTVNYTVDGAAKYNDFSLQEGENTLTVSGTNIQGLSASKSVHVLRDSRPPQIVINSPSDNFITEDPHIRIEYTADGEAKFQDYELQEGVNIITVQETDAAGNTGFASISGTLKSKAPEETPAVQPPQEGAPGSSDSQVPVQAQPEPEPVVVKGAVQPLKIIKPKAIMITVPRAGHAPLEVRFFGDRSFGRDGARIVAYLWNFGDGATSEEINPVHTFQNPSRYLAVYKVTLTVIDDKGVSATARAKIRVLRELKK